MPIVLEEEGHYVLTDLKDVRVTEEFLGLGQEITNCQNVEFRQRPAALLSAQIRDNDIAIIIRGSNSRKEEEF